MITDSLFAFGVHDFITRHLPNSKDDSIFQYVYAHEGKESFVRFEEFGTFSFNLVISLTWQEKN